MATIIGDLPVRQDLALAQRMDRQYTLVTKTNTGAAQDMTGATFVFTVRPSEDSPTTFLQKSIASGGITYADFKTGVGTLTITANDVWPLVGIPAVYSLILTLPGAGPVVEAYGQFSVIAVA